MSDKMDTSKVYLSPAGEQAAIFIDGKWHVFLRQDAIQNLMKQIFPRESEIKFYNIVNNLNKSNEQKG